MCLAVPGLVKEILSTGKAVVDFKGVKKIISVDLLEDVMSGDYVIVHAGFAINKLNEEEADATLEHLEQLR